MSDEQAVEEKPEIEAPGVTLTRERERQGLTVPQLARDLHLDPSLLEDMERGDFQTIGAPVFVKGHLKSYARRLGIDPDAIVEAYRHHEPDSDELVATARATLKPVSETGPLLVVFAIVFFGVVAAAAAWFWLNRQSPPVVRSPASAVETGVQVDESAQIEDQALRANALIAAARQAESIDEKPQAASEIAPVISNESQPELTDIALPENATESLPGESDGGPETAAPEQVNNQVEDLVRNTETATVQLAAGSGLGFDLSFSDDCWVEISDANGRLEFDMQRAGTTLSLTGLPPVSMLLGNASAVELAIDGEVREIPRRRISNNVARLELPRDLPIDGPEEGAVDL
jgi:cytoskeleton protein RodZ